MNEAKRLFTIGVYGWTAESFFETLESAGVDVVVDIRARRGVRGAAYSFANRRRLEAELSRRGISYRHFPELAPTASMRAAQRAADRASRMIKRDRKVLHPVFEEAYKTEVLARAPMEELADELGRAGSNPALLCVENRAAACHRSLAAEAISRVVGLEVLHLVP